MEIHTLLLILDPLSSVLIGLILYRFSPLTCDQISSLKKQTYIVFHNCQ